MILFLSKYYKIPKENLIIGLGSTELLRGICMISSYKTSNIISPTFWEYAWFSKEAAKKVKKFYVDEKSNFDVDLEKFKKFINKNELIFICNPNNPTSRLIEKKNLLKLIRNSPKNFFVIDETYLLFRSDHLRHSLMKEAYKLDNLFVTFSLSKFFAIGGLRCGVGVGSKKIINAFKKKQLLFQISTINQKIIPELLKDTVWISSLKKTLQKEKEKALKKLDKIKSLKVIDPQANFILIKSLKNIDLAKSLKKKGLIVRRGNEFDGLGFRWIRVCIKDKISNNYLIKVLGNIMK